jgi:hypothetical protein
MEDISNGKTKQIIYRDRCVKSNDRYLFFREALTGAVLHAYLQALLHKYLDSNKGNLVMQQRPVDIMVLHYLFHNLELRSFANSFAISTIFSFISPTI